MAISSQKRIDELEVRLARLFERMTFLEQECTSLRHRMARLESIPQLVPQPLSHEARLELVPRQTNHDAE